ncbi:hypothetical protein GlitD10_0236 [Gloeomargarita lithophora Alchichica-D10]|uniref:Uncharacterized protein n=1 Tax=Gloeomargarita lithophora Alchichica-D10 TaxID=1188229 RepID=A0A1J0A9G1_9CYAN|nr:hypothetical protein [Gloeomargarita lithophora]APB32537.1 hypothetical protein GlitD10_0236 [Gloeomargarita lithophora Alchichica-D10]
MRRLGGVILLLAGTFSLAGLAGAQSQLPVVESAALAVGMQVPWSQPVKVKDPFEGENLGVFDRHEFSRGDIPRMTVLSLWQAKSVRFLVGLGTQCTRAYVGYVFYFPVGGWSCGNIDTSRKINEAVLKIGDTTWPLTQGQNNTFPIATDTATALQQAPEAKVLIRLVTEAGELIDSEIGVNTVRSWKQIFAAAPLPQ